MNKSTKNRNLKDRRVSKVKVEENAREEIRRKEDRQNLVSYYGVLGLSIGVLLALGVVSYFYG
ncbi:MAG: hypothetical protein GY793_00580 [Proteobacteria bacterium]|nr:hypothetical protein [Pseudomonadota bacterium]